MPDYKKLPGTGHGIGSHAKLWLAEDHMLLVTNTGITEEYRRFFFADIQAVFVRQSPAGRTINAVLAVLCLLFLALASTAGFPGNLVLGIIAGGCALGIVVNLLLGPTCTCHIKTPIALHHVPALRRVRTVRKVLARIAPALAAAQGELTETHKAALLGAPLPGETFAPPTA